MAGLARLVGEVAGRRRTISLAKASSVIGSAPDSDFTIEDAMISRRHAMVERIGNCYRISDLGSTNGTFVNGRRISAPTMLSIGDEIQLGQVAFRYSLDFAQTE